MYEVCKIRGMTLNRPSAAKLNHARMVEIVRDFVEHGRVQEVTLTRDHAHRLWEQAVVSEIQDKNYRPVYRKGRLLAPEVPENAPDDIRYRTVPFGYRRL
jgi:hypothetical protein